MNYSNKNWWTIQSLYTKFLKMLLIDQSLNSAYVKVVLILKII